MLCCVVLCCVVFCFVVWLCRIAARLKVEVVGRGAMRSAAASYRYHTRPPLKALTV